MKYRGHEVIITFHTDHGNFSGLIKHEEEMLCWYSGPGTLDRVESSARKAIDKIIKLRSGKGNK